MANDPLLELINQRASEGESIPLLVLTGGVWIEGKVISFKEYVSRHKTARREATKRFFAALAAPDTEHLVLLGEGHIHLAGHQVRQLAEGTLLPYLGGEKSTPIRIPIAAIDAYCIAELEPLPADSEAPAERPKRTPRKKAAKAAEDEAAE